MRVVNKFFKDIGFENTFTGKFISSYTDGDVKISVHRLGDNCSVSVTSASRDGFRYYNTANTQKQIVEIIKHQLEKYKEEK